MLITLKPESITIEEQNPSPIDPALTVAEFAEPLEQLSKAAEGDLDVERPDREWVRGLGKRLYDRVFPEDFKPPAQREPILLDLAPELQSLPWEMLHNGERFMALNPGIVRLAAEHVNDDTLPAPNAGEPLTVGVTLASPLLNSEPEITQPIHPDTGLYDPLHNQPTVLNFREEVLSFRNLEGKPYPVVFDLYRRTRPETFREVLLKGYDIVHYSGHGSPGCLSLETAIATTDTFTTQHFIQNGIDKATRLAVLNACETSVAPGADEALPPARSIAETLCRLGVPRVVAMQQSITTTAGEIFTSVFYKHLAQGRSCAESLRRARLELEEQAPHPWEFTAPILFTTSRVVEEGGMFNPVGGETARVKVLTRGAVCSEQREKRFAGRRREQVAIARALTRTSRKKGVLLHGAGGMGKTATALEAAHRFGEDFDQILFAGARIKPPPASLQEHLRGAGGERVAADAVDVLTQLVEEFNRAKSEDEKPIMLAETPTFEKIATAVVEACNRPGFRLVILDNVEDITRKEDGATVLDTQLANTLERLDPARCRVILTSRWDVSNLPEDDYSRVPLNPLEDPEVIEFLQQLVREKGKRQNLESLREVVRRTGGHPFTLRLALGWLDKGWNLEEVFEGLTDPDRAPWQYLVEVSLARMGEAEEILYRALSLFRGDGATAAALRRVAGFDDHDGSFRTALDNVHSFSIVTSEYDPAAGVRYYQLLPLLREDAEKERRAEPEKETPMKRRFCEWAQNEKAVLEKKGRDDFRTRHKKNRNIYNYIAAADYLKLFSEFDKAIELYKWTQKCAKEFNNIAAAAVILNNMGVVLAKKGEWDDALVMYADALKTFERVGDVHGMAQTYNNMGLVLADKGEWDDALVMYRKDLEISERVGDVHGAAMTRFNMALIAARGGDIAKALGLAQQALDVFRKLGSPYAAQAEKLIEELNTNKDSR